MKKFSNLQFKDTETKTNMNIGNMDKNSLMETIKDTISFSINEDHAITLEGIEEMADKFLLWNELKKVSINEAVNDNNSTYKLSDFEPIFRVLEQYSSFKDDAFNDYVNEHITKYDLYELKRLYEQLQYIIRMDEQRNSPAKLFSYRVYEKIEESIKTMNEKKED
jgi:hypothetical protein